MGLCPPKVPCPFARVTSLLALRHVRNSDPFVAADTMNACHAKTPLLRWDASLRSDFCVGSWRAGFATSFFLYHRIMKPQSFNNFS